MSFLPAGWTGQLPSTVVEFQFWISSTEILFKVSQNVLNYRTILYLHISTYNIKKVDVFFLLSLLIRS